MYRVVKICHEYFKLQTNLEQNQSVLPYFK
jgi:hypothetical protein